MKNIARFFGASSVFVIFFVVAAILRLFHLGSTPHGLHADEASFLLNAQSLATTLRDEDGRFLPLSLHSLIDPKPALYSYLQIPFVLLLGATPIAARLPAVLLGLASIYGVYLLCKREGHERVGIVLVGVLACSPWHIMLSRATQEVILSLSFSVWATYFLLRLTRSYTNTTLLLWLACTFGALYSYHSAKVFLPLLFVGCLTWFWLKKQLSVKTSAMYMAALAILFVLSILVQESTSRLAAVGILGNKEPQIRITEQTFSATPFASHSVIRAFYNKPAAYGFSVIEEYVHYFSPDFLFFRGGEPKRYLIPFHGLLYIFELPLLLLGLFVAARKKDAPGLFALCVAALAPLPAALTYQEVPSMIRTVPLCLALAYFVALGWERVLFAPPRWKTALSLFFLPFILWQIGYFLMQLEVQQKVYQPWYRNTPYTKIADAVVRLSPTYQGVRVVNDLRPLYAYFSLAGALPLSELQKHPLERMQEENQIGKYSFTHGSCDFGTLSPTTLYIAETECRRSTQVAGKLSVLETITYEDGTAVYELLTYTPPTP